MQVSESPGRDTSGSTRLCLCLSCVRIVNLATIRRVGEAAGHRRLGRPWPSPRPWPWAVVSIPSNDGSTTYKLTDPDGRTQSKRKQATHGHFVFLPSVH